MDRLRVILAANPQEAKKFCDTHGLSRTDAVIIDSVRSIEGLRFRYEDVIRVPGWSKHPDIEDIEEIILRIHMVMPK